MRAVLSAAWPPCDLFTAELLEVEASMRVGCMESFVSLLCLEGQGGLEWAGGLLDLKKGDSVFLPAGMTARVRTEGAPLQLLCCRV